MKIQKNTPFLTKVDQLSKTNQSEDQKIKGKCVNFFKKFVASPVKHEWYPAYSE